jgi:hypothetical protein
MQQQMVLPEGGLASFLTSNLDEMDDSRLAFGSQNGINSMRDTAERMAKMGRGGDDVIIHATKNERLIPVEVSAANPELMTQVDIAIADAGADPSAYIIGSETNSVNPYTGQREFFLKKFIRGVKNVFKKLAPIIVPLALNLVTGGAYSGLSLIAQGAISGGITSLVQGGNIKKALKGAVTGGIMGGVSAGIQGFMKPEGGGFAGAMEGVRDDFQNIGANLFGAPKNDQFILGDTANKFSKNRAGAMDGAETGYDKFKEFARPKATPTGAEVLQSDNYKKILSGLKAGATDLKPETLAGLREQALEMATKELTPGLIAKYGGTAATIGGLAYAVGAFDEIPAAAVPDPYEGPSESERRLSNFPRKFGTGPRIAGMGASMDDIMVPYSGEQLAQPTVQIAQPLEEQYPDLYKQYLAQMQPQPQYSAAGGPMESFPRRTGYIAGPGTETSDDIPAMLSDGEFVMNAKAVRGAGNGSREQGVRNMYQMMRAFEGGAVA